MYNEKIEALIKAALADGELTEKEKQILFKRAEAEGVDLDEFEMVLNAKLFEVQQNKKPQTSSPKSEKWGDIRKCPSCGAILQSFQYKCDECGYEFRNVDAVESATKLFDLLQAADLRKSQRLQEHEQVKLRKLRELDQEKDQRLRELSERYSKDSGLVKLFGGKTRTDAQNEERDDLIATMERARTELIATLDKEVNTIESHGANEKFTIIKNFPVPNSKEDLLELLAMATSSAYDNDGVIGAEEQVWIQKVDQIYQKVLACAGKDNAFIDQASAMVTSLMRRLPKPYKNFTKLPERISAQLKSELKAEKEAKIECYKSVYKYTIGVCLVLIILAIVGIIISGGMLIAIGVIGTIITIVISNAIVKRKIKDK